MGIGGTRDKREDKSEVMKRTASKPAAAECEELYGG